MQVITSAAPTAKPNLVQIRPWGLLGKWVKYHQIFFIYTFFGNSPAGYIIRPVDGFSHLMAQTTGTRARVCLFGVSLILLLILEVKSPPPKKNNFGGVNRLFQAKLAKYCEFHIIETAASISTKFCKTTETTKWSSRVVPIRAQQIQDGGRPPFGKIR